MGKISRVVVCGTKGSGKTAILEQLIYGNVNKDTILPSTIEDIYVAHIETDRGTREKVRFYDMGGLASPTREMIPRHYLTFGDGYVLVYDSKKPESFQALDAFKKEIDKNRDKKDVTIVALGNSISKGTSPSKVDSMMAHTWAAREKVKLFEVNAFERQTLFEPFVYLTSKLNPPPNKSSFPPLGMVRKTKD